MINLIQTFFFVLHRGNLFSQSVRNQTLNTSNTQNRYKQTRTSQQHKSVTVSPSYLRQWLLRAQNSSLSIFCRIVVCSQRVGGWSIGWWVGRGCVLWSVVSKLWQYQWGLAVTSWEWGGQLFQKICWWFSEACFYRWGGVWQNSSWCSKGGFIQ